MLRSCQIKSNSKLPLILGWSAFAFTTLGIALVPSLTPDNTNATTNINAEVTNTDYYLNLSSTASSINMSVTPTVSGVYTSSQDQLNVTTNIPTGYKLYLSADSNGTEKNSLYNANTPAGETPSSISAVNGIFTGTAPLDNNTWGYGIPNTTEGLPDGSTFDASYSTPTPSTSSSWAAVPARATGSVEDYADLIQDIDHANDTTDGTNLDIYYGTKLTSALPSGNYTGTITYTALADIPVSKDTYIVHYDNNGGVGVPADQEYKTTTSFVDEPDHTFQLTDLDDSTIPTRDGYTFGGWTEVAPDETTGETNQAAAYSPGSELYLHYNSDPAQSKTDTTLYAIWIPNSDMGFGGKTTMQEMDSATCNSVSPGTTGRLQDARDYKVYYVAKLADGKCWMTQNLSLDIRSDKIYTSADTNLPDSGSWNPGDEASQSTYKSTIPLQKLSSSTWSNQNTYQYSYNPGDSYFQPATPLTTNNEQETNTGNAHYATGNYYNWTAAKATNNSQSQQAIASSSNDSICPAGWTLPKANAGTTADPSDFGNMLFAEGINQSVTSSSYATGGFNKVRSDPVYWVRAGGARSGSRYNLGDYGGYWSSTAYSSSNAYYASFNSSSINPRNNSYRNYGRSVRCIAL